ncbi:AMP-binding protein, partial [Micromonospora sp. DH15]|nr:AMP-binding protein [Micromonospora sp. DH15]
MTDILSISAAHGEPLPWPDATLAELVAAQAARTPGAVAVRQWDERLTYRELVGRAAGVAAALRERGVGRHSRVGVCGHRRPDLVVTVLGVLLAGACYVPLEPGGPRRRLREIAADAGVRVVVGDAAEAEFGDVSGVTALGLPGPAPLAPCPARPGDPAYVLFTSGSTGRPKGVLTTHRNVVEFVTGCAALTGADASVRSLGIASLGFDAATMDLFVPLLLGGTVQLIGADDRSDPARLARFVAAHEVNWGFITPTVLSMLDPAELPGWRTVLCGGEAVPAEPRLTAAMRPARVLRLAELPVSPTTGKLDRPALRALAAAARPAPGAADADGPADADPVTRAVAGVWARLLGAAPGPDTDFLAAGGNSHAAMRLVAALRAELGRAVDTRDVFAGRTLAGLVQRITAAAPAAADGLTTGNPPTLSPPQRRLWFVDQLAPSSAPYNIAVAHRLRGELDVPALGAALRAVAERHDVLRWRIPQTAGVPYAVCAEPTDVAVPVVDLTGGGDPAAELARMLADGAAHAFDLATGPPWQVTVYRLGPAEHVLAVTWHHAVFDGWSEAVFYADLAAAYARAVAGDDPALPAPAARYADYAVWRAERDPRRGADDLAWW